MIPQGEMEGGKKRHNIISLRSPTVVRLERISTFLASNKKKGASVLSFCFTTRSKNKMFGVQFKKITIVVNAPMSLCDTAFVQTSIFVFRGFNIKCFFCI